MNTQTAKVFALSAMGLMGLAAPAARGGMMMGSAGSTARGDISYTFDMVMFENADNAPTTGLLYTVTVSDYQVDPGHVRFTIKNESTAFDSVLTAVYFQDGILLGIDEVVNPGGDLTVWFEPDAHSESGGVSPAVLPGGQNIGFETNSGMDGALWAADADDPGTHYGLSNGEYVDIIFSLQEGGTVSQVIALMGSDLDGDAIPEIRVGAHIQRLGGDGESSGSVVTVPAPGAAMLGVIGLALIGRLKRRL